MKETAESSRTTQPKTYQEAKQELNKIFQHFMKELGWSYNDVANADFYHLIEILETNDTNSNQVVNGYEFIASL